MREYSAQSLVLVLTVMAATAVKRERATEKYRRRHSFMEESRKLMSDPVLDPKVIRFTHRAPDPSEEEWRHTCEEARQLMDDIAPLVCVLSERR